MFGAKQLLYEWMKACDHATIEYTKWGTQAELVKRKNVRAIWELTMESGSQFGTYPRHRNGPKQCLQRW